MRDAAQHVTGFTGMATFYADAHGIGSGGIDGGLTFGPGGVLFYTSYSDNSLGQIPPGATAPARQDALTPLGVASSVGSLAFVPPGFPGAGRMKVVQYNGLGNWYDVTLDAPAANGTYPIATVTPVTAIGNGPEGVIYVSDANPQFATDSILVAEYSAGNIAAYEVDSNGDPVPATRRTFMSGLSGAEGAVVDPVTGDFLFSTFGGGDRVIVVTGFVAPPSTTSSSTTTSTTTSTVAASTSTSTSTTSSLAPTTAVPPSTTTTSTSPAPTTTTLAGGECTSVPPGPTFPSVTCRLAGLVLATESSTELGDLADKLLVPLGKAVDRSAEARDRCADGDAKRARARLKQVVRQLIQYSHRLRSRSARKRAPEAVRAPLAAAADAINADVRVLRTALACPADAAVAR